MVPASFPERADTTTRRRIPVAPLEWYDPLQDIDLTDRPIRRSRRRPTWAATDPSLVLSQTELDALKAALTLTQSGNTNNGAVDWHYSIADGSLDFLAAGETATVTSTIELDDNAFAGKSDTATVTITITGSNDAPTITSLAQLATIAETVNDIND